ncbi:CIC11C00000001883 [Sungouiella intermedia]|uniref:CIC11C00000001883 n=1 Tax=Sungouiella intermedia TaxID=45354 RepID=A0A1L0BZJ9_9ASCO|nr:CIC11C00000001883 [[Candida] intermedia]
MVARKPIFANKEDANAREALKLYEAKQYKKALKLVDQNLKKNSSHAESLALKGCANHQLGHKADAEPYIIKALAKEPANYLVNHLAGIYYRSVENYEEAAKWYKAAMDHGLQNTPILRDLSLLQSQVRDYKNLKDSRQQFLESQPGYRANWTAVAIAHHLNKDYDAAVSTLAKIEDIIKEHLQEQDRYEQSECVLYKNSIIAEAGNFSRALEELEKDSDEIRDRTSFMEYKAKYLLLLGKLKESSLVYRALLQRNPDNESYYTLLETALGTPSGSIDLRLKLYDKLALFYPRADPPQYVPLTFLPASHPQFRERASKYILSQLKRGVPATFVNVKPLYTNKKKRDVILSIVLEFFEKEVPLLQPTVFVWANYFLSQHYLYLGDNNKAMEYVDAALNHSPTLVELYILKARVTKHLGQYKEAAAIMQEGRSLDLQDRFINSKTTKYLFRANQIDDAINCISLFTKLDEGAVNGLKDLHTMQANWVLVESAEAYTRLYKEQLGKLASLPADSDQLNEVQDLADMYRGLALKRFLAVAKVFKVFTNDQFDFHSYCMRRGTPRDYIDMLKWEDKLYGTPIYVRSVKGLSELYWEIYRGQQAEKSNEDPKSKKKRVKKTKPLNIKKKSELISRVESEKDDVDPLGAKLLSDLKENPNLLEDMENQAKILTSQADKYRFTWEFAYDVYLEEKKYVLALQSLRNWAKIVDPSNEKLSIVSKKVEQFRSKLADDTISNPAIVKVAQKGLESAFPQ